MKEMKQFMRIAMSRLPQYTYLPQKKAVAAKMYVAYLKRKNRL
jgi:hypothetical protein|tara:strand:+ start:195 stop:323 length:129 start_codon:yes stop_codon:yes gene_type:complete